MSLRSPEPVQLSKSIFSEANKAAGRQASRHKTEIDTMSEGEREFFITRSLMNEERGAREGTCCYSLHTLNLKLLEMNVVKTTCGYGLHVKGIEQKKTYA